jgi:hypothetical protein
LDGAPALAARAVREAHKLQVRLPHDRQFGPFRRFGYGLGWYWGDYRGDTLLHHFGSFDGARAHISFMPRHRVGVAVLLNASGPAADVTDLVATYAYDVVLGRAGAEARADSLLDSAATALGDARARIASERERIAARPSTLSLPSEAYAGAYASAELGTMRVERSGERLELRLGPLDAAADFYTRPEAVRLEFGPGRGEVVQFFVSPRGADSLEYAGYVFRRAAIRRSAAPAPSRSPAASSAGMPRARR